MKIYMLSAFCLACMLLMPVFVSSGPARAEVNVNVHIGLPYLVIPGPPGLAVIPNTYVYYPPELDENIFFYHDHWYRPHQGNWFRSPHYNGPWDPVVIKEVPRPVLAVPAGYRYGPVHGHVPYVQVKKNWRKWERNQYWDKGRQ